MAAPKHEKLIGITVNQHIQLQYVDTRLISELARLSPPVLTTAVIIKNNHNVIVFEMNYKGSHQKSLIL